MEGPGMSLFQGAASIHINNSAQDRLEEQEEIEDQKRRNEELKHKLANAFDDLLDDDEASSVNSSANFTMDVAQTNGGQKLVKPPTYVESLNHLKDKHEPNTPKTYCMIPHHLRSNDNVELSPYGAGDGQNHFYNQEYRGHLNGMNNFENRQEYMNSEQLKVMYEMRVKECQQLASQMEKLDTEIDSLRARLAAAVSDRDKSDLSLQEAHHLLASSKHKLIEMEQQVSALTEKLVESDQEKEQLKLELRSANISLQEVQQRLLTLQVSHTHDTDALFREQQDRHREDMDRLQNDLLKAKNRLDEKENEVRMLEKRCLEKDREKEEILIEKISTINRLASELEAAQNKLVSGESARLREKVSQLTTERNAAKEQVKELGSKLEVTAHELVLCRNKLVANQTEYENWRTTLNQILAESLPDNTYVGEPPSPGKLANLKEVLHRYKQQLQKLPTLQDEIAKRDKKLEMHRKQESELRARLEEHKGIEMKLNSRLAVLQNKLELLDSNSDSGLLETYKQQNEQLQVELAEARTEIKNLELKYTELEMEHEKLKTEKGSRASMATEANANLLQELERCGQQLKETNKENIELKNLYIQVCSARDSACRKLKDNEIKMQKMKDEYSTQENEYVEKIQKQKEQIEKLTADLSTVDEELGRANKRIAELQKEFTDKQKEFTEKLNKFLEDERNAMRREMEACAQCEQLQRHVQMLADQLSQCNVQLESLEGNENLMKELKAKAAFFQKYIVEKVRKVNGMRSVGTGMDSDVIKRDEEDNKGDESTQVESTPSEDAEPGGSKDTFATTTAMMMKEKAIRDQIAEKFTLEMKTKEMDFARELKEKETLMSQLYYHLEKKFNEIEALKNYVLSERKIFKQILTAKDNEISDLHKQFRAESQKAKESAEEWRLISDRYLSRMISLEDLLKSEREESKKSASSYNKQLQGTKNKIMEMQTKLAEVEEKYGQLQSEYQNLQEKYKNCKKTIFTYKDYITKKDAHVTSEVNRIQGEYRKIFVSMQTQLKHFVNCLLRNDINQGRRILAQTTASQEIDYTESMNKLQEDFLRLSQGTYEPDTQQ